MAQQKRFSLIDSIYRWMDQRFELSDFIDFMRHKSVPVHKGFFLYYLGGVALFLFLIQVITGILLLMYYIPGQDTAFESVRLISAQIPFGWLVRSLHSWSANLMVFAVILHLLSVFFTRAYARPRELTWVTGIIMLSFCMGFGFSGYLLPWNELAFFATKVGTDILKAIPFVGAPLLQLLRGGEDVTGVTLSRFFGIHVAVLPATFTMLLGLHLLAIQRQGISEPSHWEKLPESAKIRMPFFPNFILRDFLLWIIVFNFLTVLAVFFPWDLGVKADPFASTPEGIRPEWYFLAAFQTLRLMPAHILGIEGEQVAILLFSLVGLLIFLLPFLDRGRDTPARHWTLRGVGIVLIVYLVGMTAWGYWG